LREPQSWRGVIRESYHLHYIDSLSELELGAELVSAEVSELDPDEDELDDELELDDEDELLDDLDDPLLVLICCIY
jgi:hypothetical protein